MSKHTDKWAVGDVIVGELGDSGQVIETRDVSDLTVYSSAVGGNAVTVVMSQGNSITGNQENLENWGMRRQA